MAGSDSRSRRNPDAPLPETPVDSETLLRLGRAGTPEARAALRGHPVAAIARALQDLPPEHRLEFLESAERVDEIVPLLPEAEFTSTVRGAGIEESGWLVAFATPEQRIAAVDLDCWQDFRLSPSRLFEWIDAMIAAGPETLVAALDEIDPEVWVLAMKEMGDFAVLGMGDADGTGGTTDDGMVYYEARTAESEERIREILTTALQYAPGHYWRLVYGAIFESEEESAEYAARWQRNRLADLGFPEREQAMRVYAPLEAEAVPPFALLPDTGTRDLAGMTSPVPQPLSGSLVGRALRDLSPERADERMGRILGVANALAVADELPLAERETVERSLEKAVRGIDRGLAEVARARSESLAVVLDAVSPIDLFRIGATLDSSLRPGKTLADLRGDEEREDWSAPSEEIAEADRTLGAGGRPNR